ncbi:MAG: hypothetical protein NC433_10800 [Clostridiales bacterium]|nr:hypothetical protein [Clostridiales bacterium]
MSDREIPNEETLEAFKEGDEMLANGTGKRYTSAAALFADMDFRSFVHKNSSEN